MYGSEATREFGGGTRFEPCEYYNQTAVTSKAEYGIIKESGEEIGG